MEQQDLNEPPLFDPEYITRFAPWQEALVRRILGAPKGARMMVVMPPRHTRSALARAFGEES